MLQAINFECATCGRSSSARFITRVPDRPIPPFMCDDCRAGVRLKPVVLPVARMRAPWWRRLLARVVRRRATPIVPSPIRFDDINELLAQIREEAVRMRPPWAREIPIPPCLRCGEPREVRGGFVVHTTSLAADRCSWRDTPIAMPVAGPGAKHSR
jgi:hypothetical protein